MAKTKNAKNGPERIGRAGIRIANDMVIDLIVNKTAGTVSGKVIDIEADKVYVIAGTLTEEA